MITRGHTGLMAQVLFLARSVTTLAAALLISQFAMAGQDGRFPLGPNAQLTPGELCGHPNSFRYPEHIPYCSRDVQSDLKWEIIDTYDKNLNFDIRSMDRGDFKIDHYIPLCMGGSNNKENLWPQHKSVYAITDPMEGLACEKMAAGKLSQKDAIELIKTGKNHLDQVPQVLKTLNSL